MAMRAAAPAVAARALLLIAAMMETVAARPATGGRFTCFPEGDETKTASDAQTYCGSLGGQLATVRNAEENALLFSLGGGWKWIGLYQTDQGVPGTWEWHSGNPVDYTNWALPAEPSNADENCAMMWDVGGYEATWNDGHCTSAHAWCCECPSGRMPGHDGTCLEEPAIADACYTVTVSASQHSAFASTTMTTLGANAEFSDVPIEAGAWLVISAPGTWSAGLADVNADGVSETPTTYSWFREIWGWSPPGGADFYYASLVGSVGGGAMFQVGTSYYGRATTSGFLHLAQWDDDGGTGELTVNVCKKRTIGYGCHDLVVDARRHCSDGEVTVLGAAFDFGIQVEAGAQLDISVPTTDEWSGDQSMWRNADGQSGYYQGPFQLWSLVGSVGEDALFSAGTSYQGEASASGSLHFAFWDTNCRDNERAVHVHVCATPPTTTTTSTATEATTTTNTTLAQATKWRTGVSPGDEVEVRCASGGNSGYHPARVHNVSAGGIVVAYQHVGHLYFCAPKQWRMVSGPRVSCAEHGGISPAWGGHKCCPVSCGTCGTPDCHLRPGGKGNCCTKRIPDSKACGDNGNRAPCSIVPRLPEDIAPAQRRLRGLGAAEGSRAEAPSWVEDATDVAPAMASSAPTDDGPEPPASMTVQIRA